MAQTWLQRQLNEPINGGDVIIEAVDIPATVLRNQVSLERQQLRAVLDQESDVGGHGSITPLAVILARHFNPTRPSSSCPSHFTTVRGTSEAGGMAVYLLGLREPDLSMRTDKPLDLGLHDDLCEDPPAWWLLKKKKTMYHTGGADARSRSGAQQDTRAVDRRPALAARQPRAAYLSEIEAD